MYPPEFQHRAGQARQAAFEREARRQALLSEARIQASRAADLAPEAPGPRLSWATRAGLALTGLSSAAIAALIVVFGR